MWQQITTISEIDTIQPGTLVSKDSPENSSEEVIYTVDGISDEQVPMHPDNNSIDQDVNLKTDQLFTQGWWMLKNN